MAVMELCDTVTSELELAIITFTSVGIISIRTMCVLNILPNLFASKMIKWRSIRFSMAINIASALLQTELRRSLCCWQFIPPNFWYKAHQIPKLKCFTSRLAVVFAHQLKPGIKSRMEMQVGRRQQAMLQLHLSNQQFYCLLRRDSY